MRQFYIMHEQCVKIFKAYTHETVLYLTINTRKQKQIRQKQSLVHKVPSGVAILSHVSDVAAIVHSRMYLANIGREGILVFYQWKEGMRVAT